MVAVAKDATTVEGWQRLLEDAGMDAQIHIDDAALAGMPSRGTANGYIEPGGSIYSYPLYVLARDRRAARQLLAREADFGGGLRLDAGTVLGALAVVGGSLLLVVVIALFRLRE